MRSPAGGRPTAARRARARTALQAARRRIRYQLDADDRDVAAVVARLETHFADAYEPLEQLYSGSCQLDALMTRLADVVAGAATRRPDDLRLLDHRREIEPDWHQRESMVGYVCYVDRFAGTLTGTRERLDYLADLGVTYLHLMPLAATRPGANDGGYAVADYRRVEPRLGDLDDLAALGRDLRERGMSLCLDLVVNHTAREHEWARRARSGEQRYRDYYLVYDDRSLPDAYEATLPQVFPDTAPGNFSRDPDLDAWVWTSFHDYQWDLNWANPDVFVEMLDVILFWANSGVEVMRLDAVPFMWKRLGTDCQNQPEVHLLLQALRALTRVAAPALVFKAEAIVSPDVLVAYLGAHDRERPECDLAYHNQLMVMLWSGAASRDARLPTAALSRMRIPPPHTGWVTYLRGHDDIGWAVTDQDAAAVGLDAAAHRRFLTDFYAGDFPGSFARGERFQVDHATGDARTSGATAALAGIAQAHQAGDPHLLDQAIRRLLLLYAVAFSYGGIPLLYMGDELALDNDRSYLDHAATAADNRWMHRPFMDWQRAARRHDPGTLGGRVFAGLAELARVRAATPELHAAGRVAPLWPDNPHVLAYARHHPRHGPFLGLANFHDTPQSVDATILHAAGLTDPVDLLAAGGTLHRADGRVHLPGLGAAWLVEP